MALSTYADLQASVGSWINRADLTAQIPDFITLAEARFNRDLRLNAMVKRQAVTATSDYMALPSDWLSHLSVTVTGDSSVAGALDYVPVEEFNRLRQQNLTGTFRFYTIQDSNIVLLPAMSSGSVALEIFYYARIPALSGTNPTNWLLTRAPDLYLYAALAAAEAYMQNDERLPQWVSAMQAAIDSLKLESERAKYPQGAINARRRTFG